MNAWKWSNITLCEAHVLKPAEEVRSAAQDILNFSNSFLSSSDEGMKNLSSLK